LLTVLEGTPTESLVLGEGRAVVMVHYHAEVDGGKESIFD
jgi:hypothetical protein